MFPHKLILTHPYSLQKLGLAGDDFDKHFWFITGLYFIMKSWKGDKPIMLADNLSDLSPNTAMELEKVVAKYYCQQFFNYFGCAAQVPHRLFVMKSN